MSAMPLSKLAVLIATREGFYVPGSLPQRMNNPGDLEAAPHGTHVPGTPFVKEDSAADGWADLQRQLNLFAQRGLTLQEAIYTYAPPTENDSAAYLKFVCDGLGCTADTPVAQALAIPEAP